MTLAEVLDQAASGLLRAERREDAPVIEWSVEGRPFAAVAGATAEFRLEPRIARAALGTPDTAPSRRGSDWIAFGPRELDQYAIDRATAWLGSAHRHATTRRA